MLVVRGPALAVLIDDPKVRRLIEQRLYEICDGGLICMRTALLLLAIGYWGDAALAAECYSIQAADQKNACLAAAKSDKSYCFNRCFKIQDPDARAACLGGTKKAIRTASRSRVPTSAMAVSPR